MAEKKTKLKFQGRKHSKKGICSMLISLLVLAGFITISLVSGLAKGEGGIVLGYAGIGCLAAAVFGFVLGIKSFREPDILYFQPVFGSVVNGIMMVVLVALYLTGILV